MTHERTSWLITPRIARPARRSTDGQAYVVTALPEPEPEPWLDPDLWDAAARQQDSLEATVLVRHRQQSDDDPADGL